MQNMDNLSRLFRGMTTSSNLKTQPRRESKRKSADLKTQPRRESKRKSAIANKEKIEDNIKNRELKVIKKKKHSKNMDKLLNQMSNLVLSNNAKGKTKTLKNRKTKNAVRSHDGRPVNKLAARVSKLRAGQFPRRKTKKAVRSHLKKPMVSLNLPRLK